jgi:hypothetical protein
MKDSELLLPIRYKMQNPVFILGSDSLKKHAMITFLQRYFRINFQSHFYEVCKYYCDKVKALTSMSGPKMKHTLFTIASIIRPNEQDKMLQEIYCSADSASLTEPAGFGQLLQELYSEINRPQQFLRWGYASNNLVEFFEDIIEIFPGSKFVVLNNFEKDMSIPDETVYEKFLTFLEAPATSKNFKNFLRLIDSFPLKQVFEFSQQELYDSPENFCNQLIQFLDIDDESGQIQRFLLNNIHKLHSSKYLADTFIP